jgi:methylglutaconyl-CoA hydratase
MAAIDIERDGQVARVWLNRPEQHNALGEEVSNGLIAAMEEIGKDDSVRVVVLGGRGRSFCAGADIAIMKASANASREQNITEATHLATMFASVANCPKPVICRAHGYVFGGGVGLACATDLPVGTSDAQFGLTESRLGILPAVISPYVLRRVEDRHARELMMTGERFGADVALRVGLIQHVAEPDAIDTLIDERVKALLAGAPAAQHRIKTLFKRYKDEPWDAYRESMPETLADIRSGDEAKDGLAAFFEKRKPGWVKE